MAHCETIHTLRRSSIQPLNSLGEVKLTVGITSQHLKEVYSDPYIMRISPDGPAMTPVLHPLATYVSAWVDDEFVGAFLSIRYSAHEIESHALLKKEAIKHSRQLGQMFLDWAFMQGVLRVTAHVYEYLEAAKNYCIKLGFQIEGFRRSAELKNGKPIGVYMLGITRQEWRMT